MSAEELAAGSGFQVKMSFSSGNVAEDWRMFKRQLQYHFDSKYTLGQLNECRKVGILMSALGREGIEIFDTMFPNPAEVPLFATILSRFDEFCNPRKNTVFERSVYFRLAQKPEQSIEMFILELKRQASLCEIAVAERENLVRDMLVIGIRDGKLREELLRDPDLNLETAVRACKTRERTQNEASIMAAQHERVVTVDRVQNVPKNKGSLSKSPAACRSCSYTHGTSYPCPAVNAACKRCGQKGHFIKVCPNPERKSVEKSVRAVEQKPNQKDEEPRVDWLRLYDCQLASPGGDSSERAWHVDLRLGNTAVKFKLDTAAECNTLSAEDYARLSPRPVLQPSAHVIKPYNAPPFRPMGRVVMPCQSFQLEFLVMPGREENLLGFQSCKQLGLIHRVSRMLKLLTRPEFLKANSDSFQGVGKIPGLTKIHVKPDAVPRVARGRRFAYSLQDKLIKTLRMMEADDIIEPVREPTDWVSNITAVEKADGTLRVCLDPQSLNQAIVIPKFQIPKTDDIVVHLSSMCLFTVLDLKSGFWHMELDAESSKLTTFNSPIGRYRFKRMCFGINCAPELFMAKMVSLFGDIPNVYPYFDDLIVATKTEEEHDETLRQICSRARQHNVKFNAEKLQFKQDTVQFLGLIISKNGIQPAPKHIRAILEMPQPTDKPAVMRFLGLVKFLSRFIPNVSQLTANLRELTKKDVDFVWQPVHQGEFDHLKKLIVSEPLLRYFDMNRPVLIQTDSSKDGLGSVLLQDDQPVAFASRALTSAETRYSQIEKELLAIVFAIERFHDYVYGLPVVVHSDHRPLEAILRKDLDKVSPRLQRLRLRLLKYNVEVQYKPGKEMLVADALSRAYLADEVPDLSYQSVTVHAVAPLAVTPEKAAYIKDETNKDPVLSTVLQWCETNSWPTSSTQIPPPLSQYVSLQPNLSVSDGLLFFENRLIVPATVQPFVLARLHDGHLSTEKAKRLARETVFWPKMSTDIANYIAECETCQKHTRNNVKEPLHSYPIPQYPWQQLAMDIAAFNGKEYLIVVDKFSNWPEIMQLSSKTVSEIVSHLVKLFARYGIPESIVSDNSPFNCAAYAAFAEEWGFTAVFSSPHYAQSNGHAERTVQTVKMMLRKCHDDGTDIHYALLQYRNTPLADTNFSPAQILMGKRLRTKLPVSSQLLQPSCVPQEQIIASKEKSQQMQQYYYNQTAAELPPISQSDKVWVKDTLADKAWQPATVVSAGQSPSSFVVEKENGAGTVVRNRRFLRPRRQMRRPARYKD